MVVHRDDAENQNLKIEKKINFYKKFFFTINYPQDRFIGLVPRKDKK